MKKIFVGTLSFLTGSDLADAVLSCALAAARAGRVEVVDIPILVTGGETRRARFPVGWQVDLAAVTSETSAGELEEPGTVIDLLDRVPPKRGIRALAFTEAEIAEMVEATADF